ncbi:cytochrome c [Rhodobacter sp. KR11]|jgi:cytochrome c556|uniref:c-type cytochrome n=1 Tax=Rhodobacter sp. KR11 TaxID=2974588 RepID=UPI002222C18A|nr:cytochrome c [Rhodobacter sp. KR11]MCW1918987.1 cytochrome c [Rhodobacter sp. KR11]
MKFAAKLMVLGAIMAGGIAFAEGANDPEVKARQELMDSFGGAMKTLGDMAGGKVAYDAAAAEAAKKALVDGAAGIEAAFKNNATDPAGKAKPEVWTAWDDFVAKAGDLGTAAGALDVSSTETVGAGMGAIGGACKACHTAYKAS